MVANVLQIERELHSMTDLWQNQENTSSTLLNHEKFVRFVIKKSIQFQIVEN